MGHPTLASLTALAVATASPAQAQQPAGMDFSNLESDTRAAIEAGNIYIPDGQWRLTRSDGECSIRRDYLRGDERVTLLLSRMIEGDEMQIALIGSDLSPRDEISAGYIPGPANALHPITDIAEATLGDRDGILYVAHPFGAQRETSSIENLAAMETYYYVLEAPREEPVVLRTGPMNLALNGLTNCNRQKLRDFGVDIDNLTRFRQRASLRNTEDVTRRLQQAYPSQPGRGLVGGPVQIRTIVGPDGKVTECHVAALISHVSLREAACAIVTQYAQFDPALDRNGEPATDFSVSNIRYTFDPPARGY